MQNSQIDNRIITFQFWCLMFRLFGGLYEVLNELLDNTQKIKILKTTFKKFILSENPPNYLNIWVLTRMSKLIIKSNIISTKKDELFIIFINDLKYLLPCPDTEQQIDLKPDISKIIIINIADIINTDITNTDTNIIDTNIIDSNTDTNTNTNNIDSNLQSHNKRSREENDEEKNVLDALLLLKKI